VISPDERTNDYHFVTRWRVRATIDQVAQILGDAPALARWWPSVYLRVNQLEPGDERGVGKVVDLYTKGWLPYTLRWQFRVTESRYPRGFSLEATGDFEGRGIWTFEQDGTWADVTYDWKIRAEKPLLRYGSAVVKPIFRANHLWAMARGEESLRLELARREATSSEELARVPPPPPPTRVHPFGVMAGGVLALGLLLGLYRVAVRARAAGRHE